MRLAAVVFLLALVTAGCSDEPTGSNYRSSCVELADVPEPKRASPVELPPGVRVTAVQERKGFMVVTAVADGSVNDHYVPMENVLADEGFDIVGRDNEGFEAEIFFAKGKESAGALRMRVGPCPEQITMNVLFDPLETRAGREALEQARKQWLRGRRLRSPSPSPSVP